METAPGSGHSAGRAGIPKLEKPLRCLVIDDVDENREVLTGFLQAIGADTQEASTGEEGVQLARNNPFDLVFVDIHLPGMSGPEVSLALAENGPESLKRIAISASTWEHEKEGFLGQGFHGFLPKPFMMDELARLLESTVGACWVELAPEPSAETSTLAVDWEAIPRDHLAGLRRAASLYQTTEFRERLGALRHLGPSGVALADALQVFADRFDMESAESLLMDGGADG